MDRAAKVTAGADRAVDKLGKTSTTTGRKVDDLGGDFRDTARDADKLKDEIQSLERSLAGLATEFAATSRAADRIDLTRAMRKQHGELPQLLKVQKLLQSPAETQPAAASFGRRLLKGVEDGGLSVSAAMGGRIGVTIAGAAGVAAASDHAANDPAAGRPLPVRVAHHDRRGP